MTIILQNEERELLQEILECQENIMDSEYNDEDRKILKRLQKRGLVQLVWQITFSGKKACLSTTDLN